MSSATDYLDTVMVVAESLEKRGHVPILVGGMALVILGSQRITNDFDFVISLPEPVVSDVVNVFYEHGFELASKLKDGEVIRTIDNKNVASIRLRLDGPTSAYFYHRKKELRVDLLLDFPFPARELALRADKVRIKGRSIRIASVDDLIRLKEVAFADRKSASDAQDIEFLKKLRRKK